MRPSYYIWIVVLNLVILINIPFILQGSAKNSLAAAICVVALIFHMTLARDIYRKI